MRLAPAYTALFALIAFAAPVLAKGPSEALDDYIKRPQPAYGWSIKSKEERGGLTIYKLDLTSQVWRGITWKHRLNVIVPPAAQGKRARPGHALLGISGSGGETEHIAVLSGLARQLGVPVAVLHDTPNQPLFKEATKNGRGLKEDALIAYTFSKFAETGDTDWLALLPMARAAVAGMDALGELSQSEAANGGWGFGTLDKFVTLGGSKRGWTTWLSAVVDKRVIGIAPIVYDNLNIPQQIALHLDTWGHPSPSIHDYTDRGLMQLLESPRGKDLLAIVDPYSYADRLTVPKMAMIGTNDTYWPLEAIHIYRGRLPGDLFCHYVPNMGHKVGPSIIQAVAGFFDHVTKRIESLPVALLTVVPGKEALVRIGNGAARVKGVRLWGSWIKGRDFTKSSWTRVAAERQGDDYRAALPESCMKDSGRAAFIGELELRDSGGQAFTIHTPVQVWELGPSE